MASRKRSTPKDKSEKNSDKNINTSGNRLHISVAVPSLSGLNAKDAQSVLEEVKQNIFNSINDAELQHSLDVWTKQNQTDIKIEERDYHLLKSVITEYLDCYMLFGYNTKGERIIVQHTNTPKDRDAVVEFLKTIFIQHQQNNFLELEEEGFEASGDEENDEDELD